MSALRFVAFSGSRAVRSRELPLFRALVARLVAAGVEGFSVGDAVGADALVLRALFDAGVASRVRVFAVGAEDGRGFWFGSALGVVREAAAAGAAVVWAAGGRVSGRRRLPLRRRLARRSAACVRWGGVAGASALVCVFAPGVSRGTLAAARLALRRGRPLFAFVVGGAALPSLGAGRWVACPPSSLFVGGFFWRPAA